MNFVLKIWLYEDGVEYDKADVRFMTEAELIRWFDMADCYDRFDYELYAIDPEYHGEPVRLWYNGWKPNCLIEFVDAHNRVIVSGYGTDH